MTPFQGRLVPYRPDVPACSPGRRWRVLLPSRHDLSRRSGPAKHQLADPAIAARLLRVDAPALLDARSTASRSHRGGTLLGALLESLVTLDVRVYAQAAEATVKNFRTWAGENEIDLIVERGDGRILAIEVKLARTVEDEHTRGLHWLRSRSVMTCSMRL